MNILLLISTLYLNNLGVYMFLESWTIRDPVEA